MIHGSNDSWVTSYDPLAPLNIIQTEYKYFLEQGSVIRSQLVKCEHVMNIYAPQPS